MHSLRLLNAPLDVLRSLDVGSDTQLQCLQCSRERGRREADGVVIPLCDRRDGAQVSGGLKRRTGSAFRVQRALRSQGGVAQYRGPAVHVVENEPRHLAKIILLERVPLALAVADVDHVEAVR